MISTLFGHFVLPLFCCCVDASMLVMKTLRHKHVMRLLSSIDSGRWIYNVHSQICHNSHLELNSARMVIFYLFNPFYSSLHSANLVQAFC
ncbi:hypothetical protein ACQKWADRAFT_297087 [Trichoderma austrokoningii]